jgi:hypothetical protein
MSSERDLDRREAGGSNRRAFLQSSGMAAAGAAVLVVPASALVAPPAAGAETTRLGEAVARSGDVPTETVMAYIHDADKGHVTVVSGTSERTYHDPALARRLLDAARAQTA